MASVTFQNLYKIYPNGFVSVKDVSLKIKDGEFVTLHGPHGCGKSAILRMIGGLEEISSGDIYFDNMLINSIPPTDRPLAMAFQNYVLYSHFNVYDNMSLGLRLRNFSKSKIDQRVQGAADFLGISHILHKKMRALSEADKQQVALGRAIVCKPEVLLVDEDFARQDANRRKEMIADIQKINSKLGITILYVTNDYHEAMTVGTTFVSMNEGEIVKVIPCNAAPRS